MDKHHIHWYTDEVQTHAASALASYRLLSSHLSSSEQRHRRDVWFALVSFLTHAAMISKYCKPVNSEASSRGLELRAHLEVPDNSPILSRATRDNLEHFDERVDRWVGRNETRVLEMVFQDRTGFDLISEKPCAIRRVLIVDEMVFITEGKNGLPVELELAPVYEAIEELNNTCLRKLAEQTTYTYLLAEALRNYRR